jgi:DNA-binding Lrp family transcriptional regulator
MQLSSLQHRLIEDYQRDFPLVPRPYEAIASALCASEDGVIGALRDMRDRGALSRVGAAVRPNSAGASTLAAMPVPAHDIPRVADIVSAEAGVNHNYEREHAFNLWFVVTGCDRASVVGTISRIGRASGYEILDLPLEKPYFIDLGFSLGREGAARRRNEHRRAPPQTLTAQERKVICALENGLALLPRPYAALSKRLGLSEIETIAALRSLTQGGAISRLGLIVRHRELGFRANAMVVWDIPDADADSAGERFARQPFVTLCYRRPRRPPAWPYNVFCMIHGRERGWVLDRVEDLKALAAPAARNAVLFSRRCFKQRGARYSAALVSA